MGCRYDESMPVDVVLFGAHPDDVEWGAGGISLLLQRQQVPFVVVDLTNGEMGSRGTPEQRAVEADRAAELHFVRRFVWVVVSALVCWQ